MEAASFSWAAMRLDKSSRKAIKKQRADSDRLILYFIMAILLFVDGRRAEAVMGPLSGSLIIRM